MTIRTPEDDVDRPGFYLPPFREGWTYQGATYAGHSDYAVDFNRRTPGGGWLDDAGDPVLAAADGTVSEVDKAEGLVMVNHFGGLWRTESRHMSGIVVKVGDKVQRGDRLGSIGNVAGSGASFGAHLHFVMYRRDKVSEPWKRTRMRFEGKVFDVSTDSEDKPAGWTPPEARMVVGPLPKATWEGAFREALKALAKAEERLSAQKAQTTLVTDERDRARRDLGTLTLTHTATVTALAACEARPDGSAAEARATLAETALAEVRAGLSTAVATARREALEAAAAAVQRVPR